MCFFFFFQAEDGIRDFHVTGVQTCALPISVPRRPRSEARRVTGLLAARGVTPREAEVLAQIAAGRSNREIAGALHLSVRTVEKHVERLLMKTGHSRSELARFAEGAGVQPAV